MFNLANKLTLLRILATPLIVLMLYYPSRGICALAMLLFILASLTDLVDGMVARRRNLITNLGKFLDPLADKLLICSILVMLASLDWAPAWAVILIICREITVTGLRAIAADEGVVIAADRYGKLKTILQVVALCPLILHYAWLGFDPRPIGLILLYGALALTLFSGGKYLRDFSGALTGEASGRTARPRRNAPEA